MVGNFFPCYPCPEVIKLFIILNSTELEIYRVNKCQSGILTFSSMMNATYHATSERFKARKIFEQMNFHAQLSRA